MNCADLDRFSEAYVDGEFDPAEKSALEAHLLGCPECRDKVSDLTAFKHFLSSQSGKIKAPKQLGDTIQGAIERSGGRQKRLGWGTLAAASLAAFALLLPTILDGNFGNLPSLEASTAPIFEASVARHRQDLPCEVPGPDEATIQEWFSDKVDFPVRLPSFDGPHRSHVLGARLSPMNDQNAAHIVYEIEGAKVSVMVFEAESIPIPNRRTVMIGADFLLGTSNGYNVALFNANGVTYTITADMSRQRFNDLLNTTTFR
jgi:anti-sigma factor RsiW